MIKTVWRLFHEFSDSTPSRKRAIRYIVPLSDSGWVDSTSVNRLFTYTYFVDIVRVLTGVVGMAGNVGRGRVYLSFITLAYKQKKVFFIYR